eukprot:8159594-Lingulodinium_polyedra.AAC.1
MAPGARAARCPGTCARPPAGAGRAEPRARGPSGPGRPAARATGPSMLLPIQRRGHGRFRFGRRSLQGWPRPPPE